MSPHEIVNSQQDAGIAVGTIIPESVRDSLALILADLAERALEKGDLSDAVHEVTEWLDAQSEVTAGSEQNGSAYTRLTGPSVDHPRAGVRGDSGRPRHSDVSDNDLELIAERCRLKAEGARWAVERDELLRDGADFSYEVRPGDQDVIGRARELPNCFLWMNQPRSDIWSRADDYLLLADCFETLAECVEAVLVTTSLEDRSHFLAAVDMTAEAQSALRTTVSRVESHPDSDQQMVYYWLRNRASQERFYISRFMKISDPADPGRNDDVHDRAFELLEAVCPDQHMATLIERGMAKARHHIDRISAADDVSDDYDWSRAVEAIETVIEFGISCESQELVELVEPFTEHLIEGDWPEGFQSLLDVASGRSGGDSSPAERAA